MIVLWILLAILLLLALLVLLLAFPVWVTFRYDGASQIQLRLFWLFRLQLLPRSEKPEEALTPQQRERLARKKARKAERAARKKARAEAKRARKAARKAKKPKKASEKAGPRKKRGFKEWLDLVVELARGAKGGIRTMFHAVRVTSFSLHGAVTGEDAAAAALKFGRINRYLYTCMAVLGQVMTFGSTDIRLFPDFLGEKDQWEGELVLRILPLQLLAGAVQAAAGALVKWIHRRDSAPAEHKGSPASS